MKRVLNALLIFSFCMMLLLGILVYASYKKSQKTDTTLLEINASIYQKPIQIKKGRVEEDSKNLIFYVSSESLELLEVVLEILHGKTGELNYITIPVNTQMTVEAKLYQKLAAIYPEMPQYFQLSMLSNLFDDQKRYAYGQLILDDMLGMDTSYYTVITSDQEDFHSYIEVVRQQYGCDTKEKICTLIEAEYPNMTSNLSKKKKLEYAVSFAKVTTDTLTEEMAAGQAHTNSYEINKAEFLLQIAK